MDSFPQLFKELEERSKELGVESYGISLTTLEEVNSPRGFLIDHSLMRTSLLLPKLQVFLRIAQEGAEGRQETNAEMGASLLERRYEKEEEEPTYEKEKAKEQNNDAFTQTIHVTAGTPSIFQQLRALLTKRAKISLRDYKAFIFQVALPLAFLIAGIFVIRELKVTTSNSTPSLPKTILTGPLPNLISKIRLLNLRCF